MAFLTFALSYEDERLETDKKELYSFLKYINECQGEKVKVSEEDIKKYCEEHNIPVVEEEEENEED